MLEIDIMPTGPQPDALKNGVFFGKLAETLAESGVYTTFRGGKIAIGMGRSRITVRLLDTLGLPVLDRTAENSWTVYLAQKGRNKGIGSTRISDEALLVVRLNGKRPTTA